MNSALQVFRKEVQEMLRDRRVITGGFVVPILLVVGMLYLFGFVQKTIEKPKTPKVGIVLPRKASSFVDRLIGSKAFKITKIGTRQEGEELLRTGRVKMLLVFEEDFDLKLGQGEANVEAIFDEDAPLSSLALRTFQEMINKINDKSLRAVLSLKGMPESMALPIKLIAKPLAKRKEAASSMMVGLLPYLIVIWAFYGGLASATDLVAGEKERGTLETLLISPVKRSQVALGKFMALSLVCLLSSLSSLIGVALVGFLRLETTKGLFPGGVLLSPTALGVMVLVMVPTVALFAALMLMVSTFARNVRESQTQLTMVSFVILIPAMFSQFLGFTDVGRAVWAKFVPVLNTAMSLREAMLGTLDWATVGGTLFTGLILAGLMLWVAVLLFEREEVLIRI